MRVLPLLCAGLWLLSTAAMAQDQPKRFLDVTSQGYSRYEINDGDVVAFFTGGVQCSYLGYTLVTDELRYNHATQVATASGKVSLISPSISFDCETVVLDGASGELRVESPLSGAMTEAGFNFTAGSAIVHFPPGQMTTNLDELKLELMGSGEEPVIITGPNHSELKTARLDYEGQSRTASSPGTFTLALELNGTLEPSSQPAEQQETSTHLTATGANIRGVLDEAGMLTSATIGEAQLDAGEAQLRAMQLQLRLVKPASDDQTSWTIEASGDPIAGRTVRNGQTVDFTSNGVSVTSAGTEVNQLELRGKVSVTAASGVMTAELIRIRKQGSGYAITAPDGLHVSFDLAALSGNAPVDLPDLGKFTKQE